MFNRVNIFFSVCDRRLRKVHRFSERPATICLLPSLFLQFVVQAFNGVPWDESLPNGKKEGTEDVRGIAQPHKHKRNKQRRLSGTKFQSLKWKGIVQNHVSNKLILSFSFHYESFKVLNVKNIAIVIQISNSNSKIDIFFNFYKDV